MYNDKCFVSIKDYGKGSLDLIREAEETKSELAEILKKNIIDEDKQSNNIMNIDYKMIYEQLVEQYAVIENQNKNLIKYIETLHRAINELKAMDKDLRDKVLESM